MDIKKCFEILELFPGASLTEAKHAYRDMVRVWHPDRFTGQSRLVRRAEKKIKEINEAYEMVTAFLASKSRLHTAGDSSKENHTSNNGDKVSRFDKGSATDSGVISNEKGAKKQSSSRVEKHFKALADAAERAHARLLKEKAPYRFCVYQNKGETFIDVVLLDRDGKIKEIRKSNIEEKEFLSWMRHIENGEGLLIDIKT